MLVFLLNRLRFSKLLELHHIKHRFLVRSNPAIIRITQNLSKIDEIGVFVGMRVCVCVCA